MKCRNCAGAERSAGEGRSRLPVVVGVVAVVLLPVLVWLGVKPDSFLRSEGEPEADARPARA